MTHEAGNRRTYLLFTCAAAILIGCHKDSSAPQQQAEATVAGDTKAQIYSYLKKKAGQKEFSPGMDLTLATRVATLQSNAMILEQRFTSSRATLRGLDDQQSAQGDSISRQQSRATLKGEVQELERQWKAARSEAARGQDELSKQDDIYIRSIRQQMSDVRSYENLYRLVGQQLATADALLAETDVSRRRIGLRMAKEACGHVNSDSTDVWLAARICEAYIWPNIDVADAQPGSRERALDLLETCRRVFFQTLETNNVLKNYELLLTNAPNTRAADTFRVQLADWLEEKGNVKFAAEILNEIQDPEVLASANERITRVRQSVASNP